MKRIINQLLPAILGATIFGIAGLVYFTGYGGNQCDMPGKSCDCFCCNISGLRGYESCGGLGFWAGVITGSVVGAAAYHLLKKK